MESPRASTHESPPHSRLSSPMDIKLSHTPTPSTQKSPSVEIEQAMARIDALRLDTTETEKRIEDLEEALRRQYTGNVSTFTSTLDPPSTSSNKTPSTIADKSTKEVLEVLGKHGGNPDKFTKFPRGVTYQVESGTLWLQFRPYEVQQYSFYSDLETFTLKFEAHLVSEREVTKLRWYGLELPVTKVRVPTSTSPSWTSDSDMDDTD